MVSNKVLMNEKSEVFNGFNLRVSNLMVWVSATKRFGNHNPKKAILKGIDCEFKEGSITAIVGPSGSGKTTFINFLAGRQDTSQAFLNYCDYYLNGSKINDVNDFKNIIGFVPQEDIMENRNTPRQTFEYYAQLRGYPDPKRRAQEVISMMYLSKCANTVIGDVFRRGLSGGEKKRTSIGIELISNPNLLFLDEPTTGLDSTTALDIIMNIIELKKNGMTVICTIHQPSEEIMALFDKVIMLVDGQLVYDKEPYNIMNRLNSLGFYKAEFETPIECFMKIVDKDDIRISLLDQKGNILEEDVDSIYEQRIKQLKVKQVQVQEDENYIYIESPELIKELKTLSAKKNQHIAFWKQFHLITKYYTKLFFKNFGGVVIKSLIFWGVFVFMIISFIKVPSATEDPISNIQGRGGFFYMISVFFFFTGANSTSSLILPTKKIFMKDQQGRLYSRLAYFMSISAHIIPFYFINISIFSIVMFFSFSLNFVPQINLAWFWALCFLSFLAGSSVGLLSSTIAEKIEDIGAIIAILLLPMITVTGFFANIFDISWPLRVYSYICQPRFLFQAFVLNEFTTNDAHLANCKVTFQCLYDPSQECIYPIVSGTQFISNCNPYVRFNFEQKSVWLNFIISLVLMIGWRVFAFIVFLWKYRELPINYSYDQEYFDKYCVGKKTLVNMPIERLTNKDPRIDDNRVYAPEKFLPKINKTVNSCENFNNAS